MGIRQINESLSETVNVIIGDALVESVDEVAGDELKVFIDNDGQLYRSQTTPIHKNLVNKNAAGRFDINLAAKAFLYLVDSGAKKYVKEFGSRDDRWHEMFPKATRMYVAKRLAKEFEDEMKLGNYDNYLFKKYQKKGKKR